MTDAVVGRSPGPYVVVVEDDATIGSVMTESLREHGYRVTWCATATEAELSIAAELPAVVLLDAGLPDADGFELCRTWRREYRDVPVVLGSTRLGMVEILKGLENKMSVIVRTSSFIAEGEEIQIESQKRAGQSE